MQLPLQITFRHMDPSAALEARIRQRTAELEQFCDRITACRVVVERMNRRHQQGNLFEVHVDLTVPGREIAVGRERGDNHAHEDAHVAVRDAFDAARRALEDHVRRRRGEAKVHAVPDHGRVARLLPDRDCGFIVTPGGEEIYFHRNSVAGEAFETASPARRSTSSRSAARSASSRRRAKARTGRRRAPSCRSANTICRPLKTSGGDARQVSCRCG
jgi:ribosome-associated translation inhibitor RaiA